MVTQKVVVNDVACGSSASKQRKRAHPHTVYFLPVYVSLPRIRRNRRDIYPTEEARSWARGEANR